MDVRITPFGTTTDTAGAQVLEFNVSIPKGARTDVAPVSTLTITTRWAGVHDGLQVTKLDLIHNLQYVDCKGITQVITNPYSTIIATANTGSTVITPTETITKFVDVLIPVGTEIVTQQVINDSPTVNAHMAKCAYSVFTINVETAPAPSQNTAAVQ